MASTEVEQIDTGWVREPADAPSARFGWHGQARKTFMIAGWFCVFALLAMFIGNHTGHVEDIYLAAFAAVLAFFLLKPIWTSRGRWKN
ncbi:DUF2631 domain-containing protein [Gordonia sp. Z-3]|uniref:DUF2631 domain-containing protein n=2 Tax=Gordonia TaxID=2053 RepID=A0A9X3D720_9ACTN|nr:MULTISPECIES: DUF2631 domain-containing protein [Gordonia]MAU82140.1 hypothetical protein [Gordonia sp. (in: high G+C Gram-positive bacteria)]MCF3937665.1 DUF2631 domain-containing protein [Gordonia tangerina]MCX2966055.1 DUF2631 domain-containing protein [Gordonia aquimaris]MED5802590.1 DUF2631 domain-containing protein [Gordonia sp. Z-3]